MPIAEITQAADVGMGSFYNHFDSKEQLFRGRGRGRARHPRRPARRLTVRLDDPAEVFAQSFRLTGRLHRRRPELSKVLLHNGLALAGSDRGLAPRARRDIEAGVRAGRFPSATPNWP